MCHVLYQPLIVLGVAGTMAKMHRQSFGTIPAMPRFLFTVRTCTNIAHFEIFKIEIAIVTLP